MNYPRTISLTLEKLILRFPIILLTGPSQCGKTEAARVLEKKGFNYVNLSNYDTSTLIIHEPDAFVQKQTVPVIIDDIQYAPALLQSAVQVIGTQSSSIRSSTCRFILISNFFFNEWSSILDDAADTVQLLKMSVLSSHELHLSSEIPFIPDLDHLRQTSAQKNENSFFSVSKNLQRTISCSLAKT